MVYLLAAIANDAEYMPSLLHAARDLVPAPDPARAGEVWGVGYIAEGRGLIVRKPDALLDERSAFGVTPELRSHVVLTCARRESIQADAPPYRFRHWLFGGVGENGGIGALQAAVGPRMPSFLQDLLGDAHGGRLAQAMFLAELHRDGVLDDPLVDPEVGAEALRRALETMDRLAPEAGAEQPRGAFVASCGRALIAAPFGRPLFVRDVIGLERLPDGPVDETLNDFNRVAEGLRRFRARLVATGMDGAAEWTRLPDRVASVLTVPPAG